MGCKNSKAKEPQSEAKEPQSEAKEPQPETKEPQPDVVQIQSKDTDTMDPKAQARIKELELKIKQMEMSMNAPKTRVSGNVEAFQRNYDVQEPRTPSDSDEPVLCEAMRAPSDIDDDEYIDFAPVVNRLIDDYDLSNPVPKLHDLRYNYANPAFDISSPPPPGVITKNMGMAKYKQEAMGSPKEIGTWAWWSSGADAYVKDGAAMTTDDGEAVLKLRNLRNALESQMDVDSSPVTLDVSLCKIQTEGCHSLAVLLSSPRISHTAAVTTLDLSNNPIGDEGLGIIFQAMTKYAQDYQRLSMPLVRKLTLSKCHLVHGCGLYIALHLFFSEICLFPKLQILDISLNEITPEAFRTILEALTSKSGASNEIKEVDFSECHLGPLSLVYLQDSLNLLHDYRSPLSKMIFSGHRFGAEAEKLQTLAPDYLTIEITMPPPVPTNSLLMPIQ